MNWYLAIIPVFIFIVSYFAFPYFIQLARDKNILDEAKGRKRHATNVPPIGGWLLFAVFAITFFIYLPFTLQNIGVFLSFTSLFVLGAFDDRHPLNATQKFIGQFVAAALLVFVGHAHIAEYMSTYSIPYFIGILLCLGFTVFIINAYNLMDGINGLTALQGLVAIGFMTLWFYSAGQYDYAFLCINIIAAILVFLRYNVLKTHVFLGDTGSMFIGLFVVFIGFKFVQTYVGYTGMILTRSQAIIGIAITTMAVPIADTIRLFLFRPYVKKKSPFKADRSHVHHLLLRLNLSHIEAALMLFGLNILLILAALASEDLGSVAVLFIVFAICVAFFMSIDYLLFNRYRKLRFTKVAFAGFKQIKLGLNNPIFLEILFVISIFLLAISIPFHRVSTSIPTLILLFSSVLLLIKKAITLKGDYWTLFSNSLRNFLKEPYTILLLLYLLFLVIHTFILVPKSNQLKLSLYVLLFVYWLILFQLEKITAIKPRSLLNAYIAGCLGFGVFILIQSFVNSPHEGLTRFFDTSLLFHVKANPLTHSLYYNLAILFLGNNYKYLKQEAWRISFWLFLVFFVFMIVLCNAKIGLMILPFSLAAALYIMIPTKKMAYIAISVMLLFVLFVSVPSGVLTNDFWQQALHTKLIIWNESYALIKLNSIWGYGVGNAIQTLENSFVNSGNINNLNCQNQFIESFLETGIVGFLFIICLLGISFFTAWKHANKMYALYLFIIVAYMMTESLFQTQMGMVSFAFFNALFMAALINKK